MKRYVVGMIAAAFLVSMAPKAMAQEVKTLTPQMRTETGTIEAIEAATRTVTLKKADGTFVMTVAGGYQAVRGTEDRRQGQRTVLRDGCRPAEEARRA